MIIKDSGARPGTSLAAQLLQTLAGEALAACDPAAAVRRAVHVRPGHLSLSGLMKEPDKTGLHRILLTCGAPIATINTVRKHLSAVKGGRLAQAARRAATQATLVICDVDPERYEDVASGPSLPDRATLDDMIRAIDRYGIAPALPVRVLEAMRTGRIPETPKPRDPAFRRSRSESILSNRDLRNAAVRCGLTHGLPAEAIPNDITGPAENAVEMVARAIETAPPGTR